MAHKPRRSHKEVEAAKTSAEVQAALSWINAALSHYGDDADLAKVILYLLRELSKNDPSTVSVTYLNLFLARGVLPENWPDILSPESEVKP